MLTIQGLLRRQGGFGLSDICSNCTHLVPHIVLELEMWSGSVVTSSLVHILATPECRSMQSELIACLGVRCKKCIFGCWEERLEAPSLWRPPDRPRQSECGDHGGQSCGFWLLCSVLLLQCGCGAQQLLSECRLFFVGFYVATHPHISDETRI